MKPEQHPEQYIDVAIDNLIKGLRQCRDITDQRIAAIQCLTVITRFLSMHPTINEEGLLDTITNTALALLDLAEGVQASWLKPAKSKGGSPRASSIEGWIKIHTVSMVRVLKSLGDEGQEVEKVSFCLIKAGYEIKPKTIKKWVSEFNTTHRLSPERKRQDRMVENLKSLRQSRQSYLDYFTKTVRKQLRSK